MYYSLISIVALIVILIINFDVLFDKNYKANNKQALLAYRVFLFSLAMYLITDLLWGILDPLENKTYVLIDTAIYFINMGVVLWSWTFFNIKFVKGTRASQIVIRTLGYLFLTGAFVLVIINFFEPVLFSYRTNVYVPATWRYIFLGAQTTVFAISAVYSFVHTLLEKGYKRGQYFTMTLFGIVMVLFIGLQTYFPLYPFYAVGLAIGSSLIHIFVGVSNKMIISLELDQSQARESAQAVEIEATKELAYLDPLTGVKNKHAYVELEAKMDVMIREGKIDKFSFFIFDLNDLKLINDTYGHSTGDEFIINSCELIKKHFPNVEIYRYGGDEFVTILEGNAFDNRFKYLEEFNKEIENSKEATDPIVAAGFSDFVKEKDNTLRSVFLRADERMYARKRALKERHTSLNIEEVGNSSSGASLMEIRYGLYNMFYHSSDLSLLDMLNSSSCDEIVEFDIKNDTFKQLYHVDGKYFIPTVEVSYKELVDFTVKHIVHPDDLGAYLGLMKIDGFFERLKNSRIPNFDFAHFRYKLQDGSYRWVEQVVVTGEEYGISEGIVRMYVFDINNIKSRQLGKISEESSLSTVGRDSITGLYTTKEFFTKAEDIHKNENKVNWCLVTVDIEHFKFFDEWFGRERGNQLLGKIGNEMKEFVKKYGGVAGYFGQDDFVLFTELNIPHFEELYNSMRDIITSFGLTAGFLPAFGISAIDKDMVVVDAFDRATIASTNAKKDIKNRILVYNSEMQFQLTNEYRILTDFMKALQNDEITFYLQPQCEISTGKIVGAEALARWIKKDGTFVSNGEFIPILEKYGFVTDLDKFIWDKVCKWIGSYNSTHKIKTVPISINVSQIDIFNIDIEKHFVELCEKYNVSRKSLKIEITESAYAETTTLVDELVHKLRADGFMVLMDDFGSGYSSLNMLSSLKLDAIKLDAKFLQIHGAEFSKGVHILESVVNMAKTMSLPIIVEGVETKEQIDFLENLGVRYIQGYYFYKPMPIVDLEKLIVDEKNIDMMGFVANKNEQFRIREFLDNNVYSDSMLNNIIGAVAIYSCSKNHVDIVRFNQQFRDTVNVPEFADRLESIEQFIPESQRNEIFKSLKEAKEDKLNGSTAILNFLRTDGLYATFKMHFYYIGRKEGTDRFYGSATNVSELADLEDTKKLVSKYSSDNLMFINRINNKWHYSVSSHALSDVVGLSPEALEKELNDGSFAKRVSPSKDLKTFMKDVEAMYKKDKKFNIKREFTLIGAHHKKIKVEAQITYVGDETINTAYMMRTKLIEEEK